MSSHWTHPLIIPVDVMRMRAHSPRVRENNIQDPDPGLVAGCKPICPLCSAAMNIIILKWVLTDLMT